MSLAHNEMSPSFGATNAGTAAEVAPAHESVSDAFKRIMYGSAWALMPERIKAAPYTWIACFKHWLTPPSKRRVPDPAKALEFGEGFAGICHDLTPEVVLEAYAKTLYPFSHVGPVKWWTPPERSVLFFEETHLEKNLRRLLRQGKYTVTFDQDFDGVINACAEQRPGRYHLTWIRPVFIDCFNRLHQMGHAHSVEVWDADGNLVGGLYGLALGRVFFTESQFFRKRDASKVGFAVLNQHLQHWGFAINDGKNDTPHLRQTGFTMVARDDLQKILDDHAATPFMVGPWSIDPELDITAWKPAESDGLTRNNLLPGDTGENA